MVLIWDNFDNEHTFEYVNLNSRNHKLKQFLFELNTTFLTSLKTQSNGRVRELMV